MTQQKYLRFTVLPHDGKQSTEEGIFVAAYELANGDNLDQTARDFLRELLTWFREHLPVPERFNVGGSKGKYRTDSRGLSWFKPSAHEHIAKIRELISFLKQHDVEIRQFAEFRVGYVVYEDEYQVVAEPFADMN